jgi:hypothetical protein
MRKLIARKVLSSIPIPSRYTYKDARYDPETPTSPMKTTFQNAISLEIPPYCNAFVHFDKHTFTHYRRRRVGSPHVIDNNRAGLPKCVSQLGDKVRNSL